MQRLARDGITEPFPIQCATIPDALAGRDVLGRGQTGSGKTLGFGLPTLMRLAGGHTESRRPRGVVLVPTRELAMQVHDALEPLAHVMNVSIKLIAGGLPYPKQIDSLRRGVDLLIATPGRLIDLCEQGAADLGAVEVAVLDEADHMCDMGFMPAVTTLLDMTPAGGQRLLFSATLDGDVDTIVRTYLKDPVTHSTDSAQAAVTTMEHHMLVIEPGHKQSLTAELASRDGRTIVFVRTKLGADRVATQLRDRGVMAAALHGGLTQGARNRTLDQFKDGSVPVLVATDVAARGIHVDDVGLVVQADPPAEHKDYLHRAGRTARAGGKGAVVTLVLPHQRRGMMRLAESAGVDTEPVRARPGDVLVTELTGGTKPSGYPVKLPAPKPTRGGGRLQQGRQALRWRRPSEPRLRRPPWRWRPSSGASGQRPPSQRGQPLRGRQPLVPAVQRSLTSQQPTKGPGDSPGPFAFVSARSFALCGCGGGGAARVISWSAKASRVAVAAAVSRSTSQPSVTPSVTASAILASRSTGAPKVIPVDVAISSSTCMMPASWRSRCSRASGSVSALRSAQLVSS